MCHPFTANPGLNVDMTGKSPVEFFRLFFTPELILNETTRYAEQELAGSQDFPETHPHARGHDWLKRPMKKRPMKKEEVEVLLALLITMGVIGYPTIRYA